jgi:hypothetical protein
VLFSSGDQNIVRNQTSIFALKIFSNLNVRGSTETTVLQVKGGINIVIYILMMKKTVG